MSDIVAERGDIISLFTEGDLNDLLDDQISNLFGEINAMPIDYLKPYYQNFKEMNELNLNDELRNEVRMRFNNIALIFINKIEEEFSIKISEDWLENHYNDIPSVALFLYSFFVLELHANIRDAIHRQILLDSEGLYTLFEERKNKKDSSTVVYAKTNNPKLALLLANIHDVSIQVISIMTEEEFLNDLEAGYVPKEFIKKMYENGYIEGKFMDKICKSYTNSSFLKAMTCFEIESGYRTQAI